MNVRSPAMALLTRTVAARLLVLRERAGQGRLEPHERTELAGLERVVRGMGTTSQKGADRGRS